MDTTIVILIVAVLIFIVVIVTLHDEPNGDSSIMFNIIFYIAIIPFFPIILLLMLMISYYDYKSAQKLKERNKYYQKRIQEKIERGECEKPHKITEEEIRKELELFAKLFGDSHGDSISKKLH